jgi:hypothetical protein
MLLYLIENGKILISIHLLIFSQITANNLIPLIYQHEDDTY